MLASIAACAGCASTEIRAFTDPDFKGHTYQRVLISGRLEHLDQQAEAEDIFVDEFAGLDVACTRSLDVLPPTRQFTDDEMFDILRRHNIDAVLLVRETQYYEDQEFVHPYSYTQSYGSLSANTYYHGNTAHTTGSANTMSTTHGGGGYYVNVPRVRHQIELYDVATRKIAWISGVFTKGHKLGDLVPEFKQLITSVAGKTAESLVKDGFVLKKGGK